MKPKSFTVEQMLDMARKGFDNIDCHSQAITFTRDLAELLSDHFGGKVVGVHSVDKDYMATFEPNDSLPGGDIYGFLQLGL